MCKTKYQCSFNYWGKKAAGDQRVIARSTARAVAAFAGVGQGLFEVMAARVCGVAGTLSGPGSINGEWGGGSGGGADHCAGLGRNAREGDLER